MCIYRFDLIDRSTRLLSDYERWSSLSDSDKRMEISLLARVLISFLICNVIIAVILYKFTGVDSPTMLTVQLMLPLIVWEILLTVTFFPEHFLIDFIDEFYRYDNAAGDQVLLFDGTTREEIHSHGDVPRSPRPEVADDEFQLIES
uniref:Transmembrane protein n=2 Tax=Parascaris univalens TaxID=6257 RepID=A0A915B8Z0_PARUN